MATDTSYPPAEGTPSSGSKASRLAISLFTILSVALILSLGVRSILTRVREGSPGVKVTERLIRTGRLDPIRLEWASSWSMGELEESPWCDKPGREGQASPCGARLGSINPLRGVTVINLWASWCEPCRAELPALVALARAVPTARFLFVGYDEDWKTPEAFVRDVFRGTPREVVFARDPLGKAGGDQDLNTFWSRLAATGIPETFFVRDGVVLGKVVGAIDWGHPDVLAYLQYLAGV